MRKINLKDARSQLEELKRLQGKKDTISNVVALIESSGQISATLYRGLPKSGKLITKTFPSSPVSPMKPAFCWMIWPLPRICTFPLI